MSTVELHAKTRTSSMRKFYCSVEAWMGLPGANNKLQVILDMSNGSVILNLINAEGKTVGSRVESVEAIMKELYKP